MELQFGTNTKDYIKAEEDADLLDTLEAAVEMIHPNRQESITNPLRQVILWRMSGDPRGRAAEKSENEASRDIQWRFTQV